jgi:hypothetical protein
MITITYTCDKCQSERVETITNLPTYKEWMKSVRSALRNIYVDKDEFSVCPQCFNDWDKVKKRKDKEKKEEFFPEQGGGQGGRPGRTTTTTV